MIHIFFILVLVSLNAYSFDENCDPTTETGLNVVAKLPCFNDEDYFEDVLLNMGNKTLATKFCKNKCHDPILSRSSPKPTDNPKMTSAVGNAVLEEFQKSLTFLSIDLMRLRSSYSLNFNASAAIDKCNFKKNLHKPSCLKADEEKAFNTQVQNIQNSLASELSNLLKKESGNSDGLFARKPRIDNCHVSDGDALFVMNKYTESLLTTELLDKFKRLDQSKSLVDALRDQPDKDLEAVFGLFKGHPILKNIISSKKSFYDFVNDEYPRGNVLEKLYSDQQIKSFSTSLENRCDNLFAQTSKFLEEIYCKGAPSYAPDNTSTIEIVSDRRLAKLTEKEAELELQKYCSYMNSTAKTHAGFSKIVETLNGENEAFAKNMRLEEFQETAYDSMLKAPADLICNAQKDKLCDNSDSLKCSLLKIYNKSKTSPEFIKLSKASNENINQILQSLVGDGLPQADGKPSIQDIALLKSEGILPGGDVKARSSQPSVASFQKAVSSQAQPQPQSTKPTSVAAVPTPATESADSYTRSATQASDNNKDQDSTLPSSLSAAQTSKLAKPKKFSNLTDDEQKRITDMLKRSKKVGAKPPTAKTDDDLLEEAPSFESGSLPSAGLAAQAATSAQTQPSSAAKSTASSIDKKAALDPSKKVSSFNEAIVEANNNRQPASTGPASSSQVSVSKSETNGNEIKIKVAEAELSLVNEFKEKLKTLLSAHGQEISLAGSGEKFVVKLNNFEINVVFNKALGTYEALCKDASLPGDYLKTISNYFNVTIKGQTAKLDTLRNTLRQ